MLSNRSTLSAALYTFPSVFPTHDGLALHCQSQRRKLWKALERRSQWITDQQYMKRYANFARVDALVKKWLRRQYNVVHDRTTIDIRP